MQVLLWQYLHLLLLLADMFFKLCNNLKQQIFQMEKDHSAIIVEKGTIKELYFPKENVLSTNEELMTLIIKLKVATIMGNMEKVKCKIFFKDKEAVKVVETTIWATCEKNILLKAGIHIPIRRILDVVI